MKHHSDHLLGSGSPLDLFVKCDLSSGHDNHEQLRGLFTSVECSLASLLQGRQLQTRIERSEECQNDIKPLTRRLTTPFCAMGLEGPIQGGLSLATLMPTVFIWPTRKVINACIFGWSKNRSNETTDQAYRATRIWMSDGVLQCIRGIHHSPRAACRP